MVQLCSDVILVNGLFSRTKMKIESAVSLITFCSTYWNALICALLSKLALSPGDGHTSLPHFLACSYTCQTSCPVTEKGGSTGQWTKS